MPEYEWKQVSHGFKIIIKPIAEMFRDLPLDERINKRHSENEVRKWAAHLPLSVKGDLNA